MLKLGEMIELTGWFILADGSLAEVRRLHLLRHRKHIRERMKKEAPAEALLFLSLHFIVTYAIINSG